jgi:hypothetical protein
MIPVILFRDYLTASSYRRSLWYERVQKRRTGLGMIFEPSLDKGTRLGCLAKLLHRVRTVYWYYGRLRGSGLSAAERATAFTLLLYYFFFIFIKS